MRANFKIDMINNLKHNKRMEKLQRADKETIACAAFWLGAEYESDKVQSLGGLVACYDLAIEIANDFTKKYPNDTDWDAVYENGADDWDFLVRAHVIDFINKRFHI